MKFRALGILLSVSITFGCHANQALLSTVPSNSAPNAQMQSILGNDDRISQSLARKIQEKQPFKGDIAIAIDPSINEPASTKQSGKRWVMSSADSHSGNTTHGRLDRGQYFNPSDPNAMAGVDASLGDIRVADEFANYMVSSFQFNSPDNVIKFVSGDIVVIPKASTEELLARLRTKYSVEIAAQSDGGTLLSFNLDRVSLSELPQNLKDLNVENVEALQSAVFSSVNAAKMAVILSDLVLHFKDVIETAEWNQVAEEEAAWSPDIVEAPDPSDPQGQWWFNTLEVTDAWRYSIGTGVKLGIIDTGFSIVGHPELDRRWDRFAGGVITRNSENPSGESFNRPGTAGTESQRHHGTNVSNFAAAERNNGVGVAGVAPNATIVPIRTYNDMWGVGNAIKYAARKGCKVVNMSLGWLHNTCFIDWVREGWMNGSIKNTLRDYPDLVVVTSAGNDNREVNDYFFKDLRQIVVVGALSRETSPSTSYDTQKWEDSNRGDNVDIWAPGNDVEVAHYLPVKARLNERRNSSGTSYAAPMVAGAIALVKSRRPNINTAQALQLLRDNADLAGLGVGDGRWGNGTSGGAGTDGAYPVGGYKRVGNTNYLPQLNVGRFVAAAVDTARWDVQPWTGILSNTGDSSSDDGYRLTTSTGLTLSLATSVPSGTYQQFRESYGRVVVTGWRNGNSLEVLSVQGINAPSTPYRVFGTVTDALGNPVTDLILSIRTFNSSNVLSRSTTNQSGQYEFNVPQIGEYLIRPESGNYINADIRAVVTGSGTLEVNQNLVVSTALANDQTRFVLSWGSSPSDLDSHITGPSASGDRFHVYYGARTYTDNNSVVTLDLDDTTGFGPETITTTVSGSIAGVYRYAVHDYSNRGPSTSEALSNSDATLYVYRGNQLLATVKPQPSTPGTVWDVLEMDGTSGLITVKNIFRFEADPSFVIQSSRGNDSNLLFRNLPIK